MKYIAVAGERPLAGTIEIAGAKNGVLPMLAATLLFRGECVLHRCPSLSDVDAAVEILTTLGCRVRRSNDTIAVDIRGLTASCISREMMRTMRSSILFLGPLLARAGECSLYEPGGCCLGERPIDLHLAGLRALGAEIKWQDGCLTCCGKLKGNTFVLPYPSVGATENLILAALGAEGMTTICNAAREPEIGDLIGFLIKGGARIYGKHTAVLQIHGGLPTACEYWVLPDRMEAATYLAAAAITGGTVELTGIDGMTLLPVMDKLKRAGCNVGSMDSGIYINAPPRLDSGGVIRTAPYPGFPTDAQAPMMAAFLKSNGVTVFDETVFSDRYRHVPALCAMGGRIDVASGVAAVTGVEKLWGRMVWATDLRGGAAMVVAALGAAGRSRIYGIDHIQRGYERICEKLNRLGAQMHEGTDELADVCQEGIHNGHRGKQKSPQTCREAGG